MNPVPSPLQHIRSFIVFAAIKTLGLVGTLGVVQASTGIWTGGTGGTWTNTTNNWSGAVTNTVTPWDIVNGLTNNAIFNTVSLNNNIGGAVYANGVTLSNTGTINGTGTLTLEGTNPFLNAATGVTGSFSSDVAGTGGFTKTGAGIIVLQNTAKSFTGGITVNQGTVKLDLSTATNGVVNSNNNLTLSGGTLNILGKSSGISTQTLGNLTVNAGLDTINFTTNGTGTPNLTLGNIWTKQAGGTLLINTSGQGGATVSSAVTLNNGLLNGYTFFTDATGTGFATTNASGNIVRYTNATVVTTGNTVGTSLGGTTNYQFLGSATLTGGGTMAVNSAEITGTNGASATALTASSPTTMVVGSGGVLVDGTWSSGGTGFANNITLTSTNSELQVRMGSGLNLVLGKVADYVSGGVTNSVSLVKSGAGTFRMNQSGFYTYTGDTVVNEGIIQGITGIASGTNAAGVAYGNLVVNSSGTVELSGGSESINGLSNSPSTGGAIINSFQGVSTLTIGTANGNGSFNGTLSQTGTNLINIVKVGTGTQVLAGTDSYIGKTTVGGGVLDFTTTNALYNGGTISGTNYWSAANITVSNGATIAFGVTNFGNANIQTLLSTLTSSNGAGILAGGSFGLDSTGTNYVFTNNLGNSVNGSLGLTEVGTGTTTLSGNNTYTGRTTVSGGTMLVSGLLGNGNYTTNVIDNAMLIFSNSGSQTLSGIVSGVGTLSQAGTGTLTLGGANTYTGSTVINSGGTIAVGTLGSIASTNIALGSSATPGTLDLTAKPSGYVMTAGQTLSGTGTVNLGVGQALTINGTLDPGNSPGIITINGGLTLGSNSTSTFQVFGYTAGVGYDQINVNGILTYGGRLIIQDTNSFVPVNGDVFQLFTATGQYNAGLTNVALAGSWTGSFISTNSGIWTYMDMSNNLEWQMNELNGQLSIAAIPESADLIYIGEILATAVLISRRIKARQVVN